MSHQFYIVLHLLGIMALFACLGGAVVLGLRGGDARDVAPLRRLLMIGHGVSLLVVFVAGFGMMAKLGIMGAGGWPLWIFIKLGLWALLGASVALVRRTPEMGRVWLFLWPVVGAAAAWVAFTKPT